MCRLILTTVSSVMSEQKTNLSDLIAENELLITEKSILERETEELRRVTDNLNWTLGVILGFNNFPVNEFCPEKSKCVSLNPQCKPTVSRHICFEEICGCPHYTSSLNTVPIKVEDQLEQF